MRDQLPLPVGLRDGNTLDAFLPAGNAEALAAVQALVAGREPFVFLWGPPDSGRTHLLEGAVEAAARAGLRPAYLASGPLAAAGPEALVGLAEASELIVIDDIDRFAGDRGFEEAFFHLFNTIRQQQGRLLMAASAPPPAAGFRLPDLGSRLASGLTVALQPLDDARRLAVLQFRARRRGLALPDDVGRFLLARHSRRLADLVALLAVLDRAAMVHKRRLTVPFVRQLPELAGQP